MIKELSFDDEDVIYPVDGLNDEDDILADSKIPPGKFAKIIDEFETEKDEFEDDDEGDLSLDSLGLR